MPTIQALQADINTLDVIATVNEHGREPGDVRITPGVNCNAKYNIVTLGPVWQHGTRSEAGVLASCYRQCIKVAEDHDISSIAFPAIGTGTDGFPLDQATVIAVSTVSDAVQGTGVIGEVIFCCSSKAELEMYRAVLMQPS